MGGFSALSPTPKVKRTPANRNLVLLNGRIHKNRKLVGVEKSQLGVFFAARSMGSYKKDLKLHATA
jgi:hypothetical protein